MIASVRSCASFAWHSLYIACLFPLHSRASSSSPFSPFPNPVLTRTSCVEVTLPTFARSWNRLCTYRADPALSPCCEACQQRIERWRKWKGLMNRLLSGWFILRQSPCTRPPPPPPTPAGGGSSSKSIITSFLVCIPLLILMIIVVIIILILKSYLQQRSVPGIPPPA